MGQEVVLAGVGSSNYINGYRNRLVNGGFDVWQRGTSFSNLSTYGPDRWKATYNDCGGNYTQQTADLAGFNYQVRMIKGSNVNGSFMLQQAIETQNTVDMVGQWATFSCWARLSNATTQASHDFNLALGFSATTDYSGWLNSSDICSYYSQWTSAGARAGGTIFQAGSTTSSPSTPVMSSGTLSSSWTRYSVTLLVPSNTKTIVCGMYSENTVLAGGIELVGAQFEIGTAAGPFERRHIAQEQHLCERYYTKSYRLATNPGTATRNGAIGFVCANGGNGEQSRFFFPTTMRVTPGITLYNPVTGAAGSVRNYSNNTDVGSSVNEISERSVTGGAGSPTDTNLFFYHLVADAEI
jgi:hypothetical protein